MKQKTIVLIVLIFLATSSSAIVLYSDGYFNKKSVEHKILASQEQSITKPVVLAKETTSIKKPTAIVKKPTVVKKPVVKKVVPKKKVVVKKKRVNLAPPVFTPQTAPFSAKNKYN